MIEGSWMIGIKSCEISNSIFTITEENKKFELHTDTSDEFSFDELKDELEGILSISVDTPSQLQHEGIGPRNIQAYNNLRLEKSSTDGYFILLMGYARSPFRELESYPRNVVGSDEDVIQLIS